LSEPDSRSVSELLHITSEFERIGDYSVNIMESAESMFEGNIRFSKKAFKELNIISSAVSEIIDIAKDAFASDSVTTANQIEPLEEVIDILEETLKETHIDRLKSGKCSIEAAFPFVETLSNLERIADHCSNVGVHIITHNIETKGIDRHEYIRKLHKGQTDKYSENFAMYQKKYALPSKKAQQ
ncbi:MAG TPA: hypothetical protein DCP97_03070, partial [Ruminococcaceae bacterium]|nr:hypothetical protein [Oscillospiraceae bacterium]